MTELEMIILGIVTGIFTTVIIFFNKFLFNKVLVPWYLKTTYRGVDISGKWTAGTGNFTLTMEIKQNAHNLSGVLTMTKNDGERISTSSHYLAGDVWEGYASLQSNTVDKRLLSYGNLLLKIESGRLLKGIFVARKFKGNQDIGIQSEEMSFSRNI